MKRPIGQAAILIGALLLGGLGGIALCVFPYASAKSYLMRGSRGPWSIGIYRGSSPFDLEDPTGIANPVVTAKDVLDVDASFVADPFMMILKGENFLFFEVMNRRTKQGDIGYAQSRDGVHWQYKKIVLDESFHLSYPYVIEWEESFYLIPESNADLSVRLYKAISFPDRWEYVGSLLKGYRFVDPSIFRYDDKWWLFVSTPESDTLNLYYSSDLLNGWVPHPMNPIVKLDRNFARPGGRVLIYEGRPIRLTQDDDPTYGIQVFAFEITELSEESYAEKLVSEKPVVAMAGSGWNAAGMHHVDARKVDDGWMAAVDGRDR
jgi:hypothetical protein